MTTCFICKKNIRQSEKDLGDAYKSKDGHWYHHNCLAEQQDREAQDAETEKLNAILDKEYAPQDYPLGA